MMPLFTKWMIKLNERKLLSNLENNKKYIYLRNSSSIAGFSECSQVESDQLNKLHHIYR